MFVLYLEKKLLGQHLRAARGTECGNLRVLQLDFLDFLEEFLVGRVARIGPAPFDVVKTEMVKNSRYLQLVGERKAYLTVLVTVAPSVLRSRISSVSLSS